jgi:hypothetical protein
MRIAAIRERLDKMRSWQDICIPGPPQAMLTCCLSCSIFLNRRSFSVYLKLLLRDRSLVSAVNGLT